MSPTYAGQLLFFFFRVFFCFDWPAPLTSLFQRMISLTSFFAFAPFVLRPRLISAVRSLSSLSTMAGSEL